MTNTRVDSYFSFKGNAKEFILAMLLKLGLVLLFMIMQIINDIKSNQINLSKTMIVASRQ